jgi:TPP-dependent trihydroxycyclohexane-1,2-dione (THcHDO) dehydratase
MMISAPTRRLTVAQALAHAATAFAKHSQRRATLAVTSSIGPGA